MHVLIPAHQPSDLLEDLVSDLLRSRPWVEVLVVDDGSGASYRERFLAVEAIGARVLRLSVNRGKGMALKTGFAHLAAIGAAGPVVTADADGQHAVADIWRVADAVDLRPGAPEAIVLGQRAFDRDVPPRSRLGNTATRLLFRIATGERLQDTQTGLRAFPATLLGWLGDVPGERYEYELEMLLDAARQGIVLRTVPIRTIYLDDNASSHFRPIRDSVRIYRPLLAFGASSIVSFVVDTVVLLALHVAMGSLLWSVVGARVVSASANYLMNRRYVFDTRGRSQPAAARVRYAVLATYLLIVNWILLTGMTTIGLPLLVAKVATELVLVPVSYALQSREVFAPESAEVTAPAGP